MGYGYGEGHMFYGGGGFMWLIILILAGLAIYYFVSHAQNTEPTQRQAPEPALEIIKKRYARGEISKEEFERLKTDLKDSPE